jgi:hypothetical protein
MDKFLDGKYNDLLDSAAFRLMLLAVGFTAWVAAGVSLLSL